jgi:hypothetical protein
MSDNKDNNLSTQTPSQTQEQGVWDSIKSTLGSTFGDISSAYGEYWGLAKV